MLRQFRKNVISIVNVVYRCRDSQRQVGGHFHPLEVASRYRDPQLQVGENYLPTLDHL